jgi:hypothetical protein
MEEGVNKIGEIDFLDIKVSVYHDKYDSDENRVTCAWQIRNPNSSYNGIMYMNNETGEITYPDDAVIPEQTDRDREMLPKFIIIGAKELTESMISSIKEYLNKEYELRNSKNNE